MADKYYFIYQGKTGENHKYTDKFTWSELFHRGIKPAIVRFVKDKRGNWFEYDINRPKILPPCNNETDIQVGTYDQLVNFLRETHQYE